MAKNTEKTQAELYREQRKARLAKAAAKKAKKSKSITLSKSTKTAITVLLVVAIVAGIAGYAVSSSGVTKRYSDVISIGDGMATVSQAEYSFYYASSYSNYFNNGYYYANYYGYGDEAAAMMMGGFDYRIAPDAQPYKEKLEGYENPTWADYFEDTAIKTLMNVKAYNKLAEEKGIELDSEDVAKIEENLQAIEDQAAEINYSVHAYLKMNYGDGVSKGLVEKILTEQSIASKYEEAMVDEYGDKYTDEEIEKIYKKNSDDYDKVGFAYYYVEAETVKSKDKEGNETSKTTDKTMKQAKKVADELAQIKDFDEFSAAADKHADKENAVVKYDIIDYAKISESMSEDIAKWIYGKGVEVGDTKVIENDDAGYFVCYATAVPFRDDTLPISVRHILVNFAEEKDEEKKEDAADKTEETTEEAKTETAKELPELDSFKDVVIDMGITADKAKQPETYEKAELILREYLAGDRTAESFAALATENTEDTGSKETGGLYEGVNPGDMVAEFNDWCFDESRKPGDVGMVETTYGYHIMYFVGTSSDEPLWKSTIREAEALEDYTEFAEKTFTEENYPIEILSQKGIEAAKEATLTLARRQVANLSASSSHEGHDH